MNMSRGSILVGVMAMLFAVGCGDNRNAPPADAAVDEGGQTPAERGAYLMNVVSACGFCHTPLLPNGTRDLDKLYSGIDCFIDLDSPDFTDNDNGTGCLSTRNLTPARRGSAPRPIHRSRTHFATACAPTARSWCRSCPGTSSTT